MWESFPNVSPTEFEHPTEVEQFSLLWHIVCQQYVCMCATVTMWSVRCQAALVAVCLLTPPPTAIYLQLPVCLLNCDELTLAFNGGFILCYPVFLIRRIIGLNYLSICLITQKRTSLKNRNCVGVPDGRINQCLPVFACDFIHDLTRMFNIYFYIAYKKINY